MGWHLARYERDVEADVSSSVLALALALGYVSAEVFFFDNTIDIAGQIQKK